MSMHRKNDITGAELVTKAATEQYREGHSRIFGEKLPWYKRRDLEAQSPVNPPNSTIVADGYSYREKLESDRDWAARSAGLREGAEVHVPGVGDL